jgi:hypothetical protein
MNKEWLEIPPSKTLFKLFLYKNNLNIKVNGLISGYFFKEFI